jgi:hypothetical protein
MPSIPIGLLGLMSSRCGEFIGIIKHIPMCPESELEGRIAGKYDTISGYRQVLYKDAKRVFSTCTISCTVFYNLIAHRFKIYLDLD